MASPTTGTSVGDPAAGPGRVGLDLGHPDLARPGRCLVYGKLVPTMNSVSISSISSSDGRVPSRPMPPVVYGESSGTTALPGQRLDDRRGERLGHGEQLLAGVQRAGAGQDRDLLARR